eukprot:TRINITY_DN32687_c0_g1_i1.p1 TRINITY_DN32687_c0_g1~~TRINITY_DN32687_c0_g1_i1.p1  ORF type:complete len:1539 (-),score=385.40 TRINITY_DN32687_c0_g1_i1:509-5125(-)
MVAKVKQHIGLRPSPPPATVVGSEQPTPSSSSSFKPNDSGNAGRLDQLSVISLRLAEAEDENVVLSRKLAEVTQKLRAAEALVTSRSTLDDRLQKAEEENAALRKRLSEVEGLMPTTAPTPSPAAQERSTEAEVTQQLQHQHLHEQGTELKTESLAASAAKATADNEKASVRLRVAQECKDRGNEHLKKGELEDAVTLYQRGIRSIQPLLDAKDGDIDKTSETILEDDVFHGAISAEVSLQLNLALACLKKDDFWGALEAAGKVLERQPGNVKALYRRGLAFAKLGEIRNAAADFQECLEKGPNPDALRELRLIRASAEESTSRNAGKTKGSDGVRKGAFSQDDTASPLDAEKFNAQGQGVTADDDINRPAARVAMEADGSSCLNGGGQACSQPSTTLPAPPSVDDFMASSTESFKHLLAQAQEVKTTARLALKSGQSSVARTLLDATLETLKKANDDGIGLLGQEELMKDLEADLHSDLAEACLDCKDFVSAKMHAEQALQRWPEDIDALRRRELAQARLATHDSVPAAAATSPPASGAHQVSADVMELIRTCTSSAQAATVLGNEALHDGDLDAAAGHYSEALGMLEVLPIYEAAREIGFDLYDEGHLRTHSQLRELRESVDLIVTLQINMSLVCLKQNDFEGAIEASTEVLEKRPEEDEALYQRGIAHSRMGNMSDAIRAFKVLLAKDPSWATTIRAELQVASGKGDLDPRWARLFEPSPEPSRTPEKDQEDQDAVSSSDDTEAVVDVEDDDSSDSDDRAAVESQAREFASNAAREAEKQASCFGDAERIARRLLRAQEQAQAMKIAGNEHFKKGEFDAAAWCYSKGTSQASAAMEIKRTDELEQLEVSLNLNLSLCQLKLGENKSAAAAADAALRLQPGNAKGLFRRAQALAAQACELLQYDDHGGGEVPSPSVTAAHELREQAAEDLRAIVAADPQNTEARRELVALRAAQKEAGMVDTSSTAPGKQPSSPATADSSDRNPFAGMFGDPKVLKERSRLARETRLAEELAQRREAGNAAHSAGNYRAAQEHYTAALNLDPKAAPLFLNRAAARLMLEDYSGSLKDCKKALEIQPDSAKAYLRGSKAMMRLGEFQKAEAFLLEGLEVTPASDHGHMHVQLSGTRQAIRSMKVIETSLTPALTGTAVEAKQVLRLVEDMEKMQQVPASVTRPFRLQAILQSRESSRGSEAEQLSEDLLRECQGQGVVQPNVWYWRGLALLMVGDRTRAKSALREARDVAAIRLQEPDQDAQAETAAKDQDLVTPEERQLQEITEAARDLLSKLEQGDKLKDKGNYFFTARRWEEAVECYEDALRACTRDSSLSAVLHTNICASLRRVEQRSGDALKHAMKAVEANPQYAKAYFRRGVLHYDAGRWEQSFEDFRQAQNLEPNLQGLDVWLRRGRHAAREGTSRKNHYKELGLLCECEQEEVKKKFRQLARECHPDKVRDAPAKERTAAEARFKAVNEAHEVLGSVSTRKEYDFGQDSEHEHLRWGSFPQRSRAARPRASHFRGGHPWGYGGHFGSNADYSDDDFFFS